MVRWCDVCAQGYMDKVPCEVKGYVEDAARERLATLSGAWNSHMYLQVRSEITLNP